MTRKSNENNEVDCYLSMEYLVLAQPLNINQQVLICFCLHGIVIMICFLILGLIYSSLVLYSTIVVAWKVYHSCYPLFFANGIGIFPYRVWLPGFWFLVQLPVVHIGTGLLRCWVQTEGWVELECWIQKFGFKKGFSFRGLGWFWMLLARCKGLGLKGVSASEGCVKLCLVLLADRGLPVLLSPIGGCYSAWRQSSSCSTPPAGWERETSQTRGSTAPRCPAALWSAARLPCVYNRV